DFGSSATNTSSGPALGFSPAVSGDGVSLDLVASGTIRRWRVAFAGSCANALMLIAKIIASETVLLINFFISSPPNMTLSSSNLGKCFVIVLRDQEGSS